MQTIREYMYKNLHEFVMNRHNIEDLILDFQIGHLFEEPLNRLFQQQRFLETTRFDYERPKDCQIQQLKKPDFKIVQTHFNSPYCDLFRQYGQGALEIKVHLNADKKCNTYDKGDRYSLYRKMQESGFKWGVLLTLYKQGEVREWSCVER